jgi:hypothetical protein
VDLHDEQHTIVSVYFAVQQSVKDVNQTLVDEDIVSQDKIGVGQVRKFVCNVAVF